MKLSGHLRGQVEVKGLTDKEPNLYLCSEVVRVDVQVRCAVDPSVIWILNTHETCRSFSNMPTKNQSTNPCPQRLHTHTDTHTHTHTHTDTGTHTHTHTQAHTHTHTHTHTQAPTHTSILTIQSLIYKAYGQQVEMDEDGSTEQKTRQFYSFVKRKVFRLHLNVTRINSHYI